MEQSARPSCAREKSGKVGDLFILQRQRDAEKHDEEMRTGWEHVCVNCAVTADVNSNYSNNYVLC